MSIIIKQFKFSAADIHSSPTHIIIHTLNTCKAEGNEQQSDQQADLHGESVVAGRGTAACGRVCGSLAGGPVEALIAEPTVFSIVIIVIFCQVEEQILCSLVVLPEAVGRFAYVIICTVAMAAAQSTCGHRTLLKATQFVKIYFKQRGGSLTTGQP